MNTTSKEPAAVAADFVRRIAAFVKDPDKLAEIDRLNAAEENPNICHSHDFCDANVFMAGAVNAALGNDPDHFDINDDTTLWHEAWSLAKREGFVKLSAPLERQEFQGNFRYKTVVIQGGSRGNTVFVEWFPNDEAATAGITEIMADQGYTVTAITFGEITEVEVK